MKRQKSFFISVVLIILFVACVAGQPAAKFVYVADATSNQVHAYATDSVNGALTTVPGSPFSAGLRPAAIASHPSNRFLYVVNGGSDNISAYAIDPETGALTDAPGAPFAAGDAPSGIAIHPSGRFLFVANTASNDVSVYTINRVTGALTPVAGSPFPTAAAPSAIAADPHGRFIYIAAQGVISAYRIDPLTGVLTHIDDSPADMERPATDLVVDNTGTFLYAGSAGQVRGFRLEPASGQVTPLPDITGLSESVRATLASRGQSIHAAGSVYHVDSQTGSLGLVRTSAAQSTLTATVLAGAALITDFAGTGTHNNLNASLGMQFTVGAAPLNVTALGRIFVPGNTGTHTVKLIRASDKTEVPGGSAVVSLADGTAGQFVYAQLPTPVTLAAHTAYYLLSEETAGGDEWYELGPVTVSSAATVNGGAVYLNPIGYQAAGAANTAFVPVNLLYTATGQPPTVAITVPAKGATLAGNNMTLAADATAAAGTIKQVQFQLDGADIGSPVTQAPYTLALDATKLTNGSHTVSAVATDSSNFTATAPPVAFIVNNNPAASVTAPVNGATISGSGVLLAASATPVPGLTVASVQFVLDNANYGALLITPPYTLTLDASTLSNGPHTVVAVVTDSAGNSTQSAPVAVTVNNTVTTVSIASPTPGALVSGPITVVAAPSPGTSRTIKQVQFKLDGSDTGAPVTKAPYSLILDTTKLSNGVHTLAASATDSGNTVAVASPVSITVANGGPPASGTPLITGFTAGVARNIVDGWFGMQFTVGSAPISVASLGRIYIAGNAGTHTLKLIHAADKTDVPGASVTVAPATGVAGQFVYADLPAAVLLQPNTTYYLVSEEKAGGDQWYELTPVTTTNAAQVNGAVAQLDSLGFQTSGSGSNSYVPLNLLYTVSAPPTVTITAPANGDVVTGNNLTVTATATAVVGTVKQVQFRVDGVNQGAPLTAGPYTFVLDTTKLTTGSHSISAIATDSSNISSAPATINVLVNNYPSVSVTAPAAGAILSGKDIALSASASAVPGLTVQSVQFVVDGANIGAPVTSAPYTTLFDSTDFPNGPHTITAVVTDSANTVLTSTPIGVFIKNQATTVAITSPAPGAVVSGPLTISAAATPGTSRTIKFVQFKLDGVSLGAPVTSAPFTATVDTTALANGPHTVSAVATDSANTGVPSPVVGITVNNGPPVTGATVLVTSYTAGAARNIQTGSFGMQFTVGAVPISVSSLGRVYISGNSGNHVLKLIRAADKSDVPGGSATVSLAAGGTTGQFVYAVLPAPVILSANTAYYLVSQETAGGDEWYELSPVTTTGAVQVNSAITQIDGLGFQTIGSGSNSFVPVNLLYTVAGPPSVSITAPAAGSTVLGNNIEVTAAATAANGTIKQVQFRVDGNNYGSPVTAAPYKTVVDTTKLTNGAHTLSAVATDSYGNNGTSANVNITVKNNPSVSITAPLTGTTVSGDSVAVTASASAVPGLTVSSVQFIVDNANLGAPITTAPYTATLDTTKLTNGIHTVVAVVTDSANNTATSAAITLTVNNAATSVTITSPANGTQVSGTINLTASATPGTSRTITQVQFKVDNTNLGAPMTKAPYTASLDTTTLGNGSHILSTVATDSANTSVTSTITVTVSNGAPPPAGTALVTGFNPGTARNTLTASLGMQFTVGTAPMTVTALGRIYIDGNNGTHRLRLINASDRTEVAGGSVVVSMAGGTPGQFVYALLESPIKLAANTTYYLLSDETAGGDNWYELSPLTTTSAARITSGIAYLGAFGFRVVGAANTGYVPVNLLYTAP